MDKYYFKFVAITLVGLFALPVLSAEVKLHVEITGGSFDAKSHDVKGMAKRSGAQYTADQITIPIAGLDSGNKLRDNHMKNKYLEAGKYPNAVLSAVKASNGKFVGKLSLHGITKPVEGEYQIHEGQIQATFKTDLTQFSIAKVNYMGIGVEDEVEITASVPIEATSGRMPASKK